MMIRHLHTEHIDLDLSRVQAYAPAASVFVKTALPVACLATFSRDAHWALLICVVAYAGLSGTMLVRGKQPVVLFDTSAIALDALFGTVFHAIVDVRVHPGFVLALVVSWACAGLAYKVTAPPQDRRNSPFVALFTAGCLLGLTQCAPLRASGFEVDMLLAPLRACAYAAFAVLDGYAINLYAARRDGAAQRLSMSIFLHGALLYAPTGQVLGLVAIALGAGEAVSLYWLVTRDTSKKRDDEGNSAAELSLSLPLPTLHTDAKAAVAPTPKPLAPVPMRSLVSASVLPPHAPVVTQGSRGNAAGVFHTQTPPPYATPPAAAPTAAGRAPLPSTTGAAGPGGEGRERDDGRESAASPTLTELEDAFQRAVAQTQALRGEGEANV